MEMIFCPLYSGSSGNCLFVQYGATRLLIDAGKSGKMIDEALDMIGVVATPLTPFSSPTNILTISPARVCCAGSIKSPSMPQK